MATVSASVIGTIAPLRGVAPIAPTPFLANGALDLDGQRRVIDCMIDQGVDAICILANYSEQFVLTDEERQELMEVCLTHTASRVPIIVTVSHFSTRIAADRARRAAERGAAMLMLMPPYHGASLRADEPQIVEHFAAVAEASRLPIMVQDAPMAGTPLSVGFLTRLAQEVPLVRAFKVEVSGAAQKLRNLIAVGGSAIVEPFDGEESITLLADLEAGATGTMPSALLPDKLRPVVMSYLAGQVTDAERRYNALLPLINYENRQCGFRATKAVLQAGGVILSDHVRHPSQALHPLVRDRLLTMAREADVLALRWGK